MPRSRYLELMAEEGTLVRGAKGAFSSVDELAQMLKRRAEFAMKIEAALKAGELSQDQYDSLTQLNRQHGLGLTAPGLSFGQPYMSSSGSSGIKTSSVAGTASQQSSGIRRVLSAVAGLFVGNS